MDALAGETREENDSAGRQPDIAAGPGNASAARKEELGGGCEVGASLENGLDSAAGRKL